MISDSTASCPQVPPLFAAKAKTITRERRAGLDLVSMGTGNCRHFDFALRPLAGEDLTGMLRRLAAVLQEHEAVPVLQFGFGELGRLQKAEEQMRQVFGEVNWPVTWAEGAGCTGTGMAGIQVIALSGQTVEPIRWHNRVVGSIYQDEQARHLLLGGLGPESVTLSQAEQTHQTLQRMETVLQSNGFAFSDLIRTWFYLQDILSWYNDFNKVRTAFYSQHQFRIGATPASTGVNANNPAGAALALAAWAVQPLNSSFKVQEVISPLQCPAPSYGSSFSRAVEFSTSYGKRLLVSGTASIEPGGKTVWLDDLPRQVELTMEVIEAILKSRGIGFSDVTRATAYFKRPEYVSAFNDWCSTRGVHCLPSLNAHCAICRDDLLFELELDAVAVR